MSRRVSLGAFSTDAAASRAVTLRELKSLPPIPRGSIYIPSDFSEAPSVGSRLENATASVVAVVCLGVGLVWLLFF